jgi:putative oxidoreductase
MNKLANVLLAPGHNSFLANVGLLLLRVWIGGAMALLHGWPKLVNFSTQKEGFMSFAGLPPAVSLGLAIFGELACAVLVAAGLVTRFGAAVAAFTMGVAFFVAHGAKLSGEGSGEMSFLYLAGFVVILVAGPGQLSIDGLLFKRKPMA